MKIKARYGGLCERCRCRFPAGTLIEWAPGARARHATSEGCVVAEQTKASTPARDLNAPQPSGKTMDASAILLFLSAAQQRGLRHPRAAFLGPENAELVLSIAGPRAKVPGSMQVALGREWLGRVEPHGNVIGRLAGRDDVLKQLDAIAANPSKAAAEYGALLGQCSFCSKALADEGSVEVGYGPVCAKRYGLPWKRKGVKDLRQLDVPTDVMMEAAL